MMFVLCLGILSIESFDISSCVFSTYCLVIVSLYSLFQRFEKIMNEMLCHLERQPRNKERRIAWLRFIEPCLNALGLILLAHFKRIFLLIFRWMHVDDEETVLLVRYLDPLFNRNHFSLLK